MKKQIYILLLTAIVCLFTGCGNAKQEDSEIQSSNLLTKGDEIVSLMNEMVRSESYQAAVVSGDSLQSEIDKIADGDYTASSAVYEISIPDATYDNIMSISMDGDKKDDMSDELYAYLEQRMLSSIACQINGAYVGASYLAVSSVFSASKTFVNSDMESDTIYLYIFENGYPVMISFVRGDDGAVSATGYFIMYSDLAGATQEDVENMIENTLFLMGAHVERIR